MQRIKTVNPILNTVICERTSVPISRCDNCRACLNIETFEENGTYVTYVFCEDD